MASSKAKENEISMPMSAYQLESGSEMSAYLAKSMANGENVNGQEAKESEISWHRRHQYAK
jgi:hypothetical protein